MGSVKDLKPGHCPVCNEDRSFGITAPDILAIMVKLHLMGKHEELGLKMWPRKPKTSSTIQDSIATQHEEETNSEISSAWPIQDNTESSMTVDSLISDAEREFNNMMRLKTLIRAECYEDEQSPKLSNYNVSDTDASTSIESPLRDDSPCKNSPAKLRPISPTMEKEFERIRAEENLRSSPPRSYQKYRNRSPEPPQKKRKLNKKPKSPCPVNQTKAKRIKFNIISNKPKVKGLWNSEDGGIPSTASAQNDKNSIPIKAFKKRFSQP